MQQWTLTVATMLLLGGCIVPAHADILFLTGNNPQPDEQNVLYNGAGDINGPAFTIEGHLNQTDTSVSFTSSSLLLASGGIGQATIKACTTLDPASCGTPATFRDLLAFLSVPPGGVFTDFIFNLDAVADGSLTVTVTEGNGSTQAATLNNLDQNGQNFYTVIAINGQDIRSVLLNSTVGIVDATQIRLSGVVEGTSAVPEPASIFLLGSVLSGLMIWKRKRSSTV